MDSFSRTEPILLKSFSGLGGLVVSELFSTAFVRAVIEAAADDNGVFGCVSLVFGE